LKNKSIDAVVTDPPYGISFMNKKWDYDVPSIETWKEVLRVLKPGGHALIACGTRTQHRMVCNIEDAGFEIRDCIMWVYGSGFPKSLNIGKAVDKLQGNERKIVGKAIYADGHEQNSHKSIGYSGNKEGADTRIVTKGISEWEGWGTGLKPAYEIFTLCRKPISEKNTAKNVLKWGTGGINIDGCRVEVDPIKDKSQLRKINRSKKEDKNGWGMNQNNNDNPEAISLKGRFPANIIHDGSEEVLNVFPDTKSGKMNYKVDAYKGEGVTGFLRGESSPNNQYGDSGSASRFFYCAKASTSERNAGCENLNEKKNFHPTCKPIKLMEYLIKLISKENSLVLDPFFGSGTTGIACINQGRRYIGIELKKEYYTLAKERIKNLIIK
jgi:site-specific DNA-methyltransferase (adenine-specific)